MNHDDTVVTGCFSHTRQLDEGRRRGRRATTPPQHRASSQVSRNTEVCLCTAASMILSMSRISNSHAMVSISAYEYNLRFQTWLMDDQPIPDRCFELKTALWQVCRCVGSMYYPFGCCSVLVELTACCHPLYMQVQYRDKNLLN